MAQLSSRTTEIDWHPWYIAILEQNFYELFGTFFFKFVMKPISDIFLEFFKQKR